MNRSRTLALVLVLLALALTGCATGAVPETPLETALPVDAPITLTMLCSLNSVDAQAFADGVHEKLPHITLDCEPCPIGALPYADEVTRRVTHDAASDIFMTSDADLWRSGKLLDLTSEDFVSKYNLSIMKTLSGDGAVYFVPGLGDVLCYLYNAQWLEASGLPVPQTEAELDAVFAAIAQAGKQPFVVPYSQMPTQYVKVLIAGYLSTPKGQQWMSDYNQGKTTMAQDAQWQKRWKRVEALTQKGYLRSQDMVFSESRRMAAIQDENAFMTTFSSAQYSKLFGETKEVLKVLPLVGENAENQMVYTAPSGYFAVSHRLASEENSAKRAAALQVLSFISTPEGQELLRGNCPLAISYLEDTALPIEDRYANLADIIQNGAYTQMPTFERGVEKVIEEAFGQLLEGKITAEEAIAACDRQNAAYVAAPVDPLPVLGTATAPFEWSYIKSRTEELAIVDFCLDSVRKAAGTDYALELGTAFRGEFFEGDITSADVESVIRQEKKLYIAQVTGQQIWDIISQGVVPQKSFGWFIAPSGFRYTYRRLADGSGELLTVTSEDGTPLDMQKTYSVAVSENQIMKVDHVLTFSEAERQELPFTLREAVTASIKAQGTITPKTDGRVQVVAP
ncbi:MAG: 5'-nucleotidase C-terminal domain-containing protein [Clostridia bacterium]